MSNQGRKAAVHRVNSNTYEIMHRGREYTIIHKSHALGGGFKLYVNGGAPKFFYTIPEIMIAYPHLAKKLSEIYNAEFRRR